MLCGFNRNDIAEQTVTLGLHQIAIHRRVAQHQTNQQTVLTVFRKKLSQRVSLLNRGNNRLFGENGKTRFKPHTNMIEMHVVWRADHQKIELLIGDQLFRRCILLASRNAMLIQFCHARRGRIDIADNLEIGIKRIEDKTQITQTIA
ncbi:hypothetical protein D3C80_1744320 [compost metagenome]